MTDIVDTAPPAPAYVPRPVPAAAAPAVVEAVLLAFAFPGSPHATAACATASDWLRVYADGPDRLATLEQWRRTRRR